jgi:radical SAM superfamily enzyme YgiQ (UPF0313 family)
MGFLLEAGFAPRALDLAVQPLDEAMLRAARFVGVSVPMHTALRLGVEVARRVRALAPAAHLCFYGTYAPLNRDYLTREGLADSVIGGEVEEELLALVERLSRGDASAPRPVVLDRLRFALPARASLRPLEKYAHLLLPDPTGATPSVERVAGYVEASRGCLHQCRHCPIPPVYDGRFFVVKPEAIAADVRQQVAAGARHITFGDPDFLNGPEHAMRVARALHNEFPSVTFDVTAKIEHILLHRERFAELRALGCLFVVSAVESLSARVLEILDKGHTRADVDEALGVLRRAGLALRPSLVPFTPWSTLDDYLELCDFIVSRELIDQVDPIQMAIRLLIPPGSKLLELDQTRRIIGGLAADRLTYQWTHADPRMDALHAAALPAVEAATSAGEDPRETHRRLRGLALDAAAGRTLRALAPVKPTAPPPIRSPRLSEAWFC